MNGVTGLAKLGEWLNTGSSSAKIFKGFLIVIISIPTLLVLGGLAIAGHVKFKKLNSRNPEQKEQIDKKVTEEADQISPETEFYKNEDGKKMATNKSYSPLNPLILFLKENKLTQSDPDGVLKVFKEKIECDYNNKNFLFKAINRLCDRIKKMVDGCNGRQYLEVKKFIDLVKSDVTCSKLTNESPDPDNKINTIADKLSSAEKFYENESKIKTLTKERKEKIDKTNNIKSNLNSNIDNKMKEANGQAEEINQLQLDIDKKTTELTNMGKKLSNSWLSLFNRWFSNQIEDLKKQIEDSEGKLKEEENNRDIKVNAIKELYAQLDDENIKNDKDILNFSKKIEKLTNDNKTILSRLGVKRREELDNKIKDLNLEYDMLNEQVKLQGKIQEILSTVNGNLETIESSLKKAQNALTQNATPTNDE